MMTIETLHFAACFQMKRRAQSCCSFSGCIVLVWYNCTVLRHDKTLLWKCLTGGTHCGFKVKLMSVPSGNVLKQFPFIYHNGAPCSFEVIKYLCNRFVQNLIYWSILIILYLHSCAEKMTQRMWLCKSLSVCQRDRGERILSHILHCQTSVLWWDLK